MRILASYPQGVMRKAKRAVEQGTVNDIRNAAEQLGFHIDFVNHAEHCKYFYTAYQLDMDYRARESRLIRFYDDIEARLKEYDVLLIVDVNPFHPDFLEKIKAYTIFYSFDDPDGSFNRSMPYSYALDHVVAVTPLYNSETPMRDQFLKWGAKDATILPLGVISSQYRTLNEDEIFNRKRENDLVFVGSPSARKRMDNLFYLKKKFGNNFKLHGQWLKRSNVKNILVNKNYYWITPHNDLPALYLNSKIGINIHDSEFYGFGNRRNYELPLNGVMLISDHAKTGLADIYELGREAIAYNTIEEAADLISYYIQHEDERMEIARNGFRKVKENYLFTNIVKTFFARIQREHFNQ